MTWGTTIQFRPARKLVVDEMKKTPRISGSDSENDKQWSQDARIKSRVTTESQHSSCSRPIQPNAATAKNCSSLDGEVSETEVARSGADSERQQHLNCGPRHTNAIDFELFRAHLCRITSYTCSVSSNSDEVPVCLWCHNAI